MLLSELLPILSQPYWPHYEQLVGVEFLHTAFSGA